MAAQLSWGTATLAYEELAQEPDWQSGLKVALAYAYRHNIVCRSGDSFVSSHITTDARRDLCQPPLEQVNLRVSLSQRSVCSLENIDGVSRWLVYAGCGRGQTVRAATMLPESVAALFGSMAEPLRTPSMAMEAGMLKTCVSESLGILAPLSVLQLARPGFTPDVATRDGPSARADDDSLPITLEELDAAQRTENTASGSRDATGPDTVLSNSDCVEDIEAPSKQSAHQRAQMTRKRIWALLEPACALMESNDFASGEEVGHGLQELARTRPEISEAVRELTSDMLDAECPPLTVDTMHEARRRLCSMLEKLCMSSGIQHKRRKIKTYAYVQTGVAMALARNGGCHPP